MFTDIKYLWDRNLSPHLAPIRTLQSGCSPSGQVLPDNSGTLSSSRSRLLPSQSIPVHGTWSLFCLQINISVRLYTGIQGLKNRSRFHAFLPTPPSGSVCTVSARDHVQNKQLIDRNQTIRPCQMFNGQQSCRVRRANVFCSFDVQFFADGSLEESNYNVICSHCEAEMPWHETSEKHYKNKHAKPLFWEHCGIRGFGRFWSARMHSGRKQNIRSHNSHIFLCRFR